MVYSKLQMLTFTGTTLEVVNGKKKKNGSQLNDLTFEIFNFFTRIKSNDMEIELESKLNKLKTRL